ncbi:MAG: dephospho-CoA kinase [Nitrospinaceae bacterium]|nr:dephospho-CoA kinase [Nitrospinaceae bacterium]NIR56823.1 dephospho-CoA kinase [Nitrospinaceae bacterium]NIS87287.1 dephospho-CoA kinase [Nitrospinaceae bacterium]NIT84143.1 dephospho-CoA kinase [Nitrospinaceae bacterium]NIU46328.1 dephospho-CoA kinase [Nitrospinaceae bacterium]
MSLLVGLTGGMGSGKTLAASLFKDLGAHVIDADLVCRKLMEPGGEAWKEIVRQFGNAILRPDQTLDRKKIADIVFRDPEKKSTLEAILHPRVFEYEQKIYEALRRENPKIIAVVDAALLIESGNYQRMDKVIVVQCDPELQIQRVMNRNGWSRQEVEARLRTQMSLEEKLQKADYVLKNDANVDHLRKQVTEVYEELQRLA